MDFRKFSFYNSKASFDPCYWSTVSIQLQEMGLKSTQEAQNFGVEFTRLWVLLLQSQSFCGPVLPIFLSRVLDDIF